MNYLSSYYSVEGKIIKEHKIDNLLNFVVVLLNSSNYFLPKIGTYAVYIYFKKQKYFGTANVDYHSTTKKSKTTNKSLY